MFLFASVAYRKCYSSLLYAESIEPLIQSGFSHVFGVYSEPIETVWRLHLSFYLSHYPIRVMNPLIGAISKWKYLLLLKLWCPGKFFVQTLLLAGVTYDMRYLCQVLLMESVYLVNFNFWQVLLIASFANG